MKLNQNHFFIMLAVLALAWACKIRLSESGLKAHELTEFIVICEKGEGFDQNINPINEKIRAFKPKSVSAPSINRHSRICVTVGK